MVYIGESFGFLDPFITFVGNPGFRPLLAIFGHSIFVRISAVAHVKRCQTQCTN